MEAFDKIAPYLADPLVLSGFALFVMAGLFRAFLKSDRLSATLPADSGRILLTVVWVMGAAAVLTIILGFVLALNRQQQPVRPVVDAGQLIARIEELARENGALERDRTGLSQEKAALEATVRQLVEQSSRLDSPPGLADALALAQRTGDPSGVVTLLTRHAETLAADARKTNQAAAANLRQAATLAQWTDTRAALAAIRRATELDPDHLWSWIERGRLETQSGDRPAAHRSFVTALERAKAAGDERMEGVAYHEIAVLLLAAGDLKAALDLFVKQGAIAERLAARDPENTEWQHDLSTSYERIGYVRVASGDLAGAQRSYEAGLAIAERLAARDPANAGWQRDRVVSYWGIADVLAQLPGSRGEALVWYRRALGVVEAMKAAGRWAPADEQYVGTLRGLIAALEAEDTTAAR